jgi:hypothetical protein
MILGHLPEFNRQGWIELHFIGSADSSLYLGMRSKVLDLFSSMVAPSNKPWYFKEPAEENGQNRHEEHHTQDSKS